MYYVMNHRMYTALKSGMGTTSPMNHKEIIEHIQSWGFPYVKDVIIK